MYEAHESGESFLAAQCDPSEAFEFIEEAFDLMTLLIKAPVDWRGYGAAGISFDLRGCAEVIGDEGAQRIGVIGGIGGIGDNVADTLHAGQKGLGLRTVAIVPRRRMNP